MEVMESVIISPGNYAWKKEWSVVGMSTLLQDLEHQNLQEDRTEVLKFLVPLCLHIKPTPKSEVEYYYQKSSVFGLYVCGLLVISIKCKCSNGKNHSILGEERRKRLRCPNQRERRVLTIIFCL